MAMVTSNLHLSYFSTSIDTNLTSLRSVSRQCITLQPLPPPHSRSQGRHSINTATYGEEVARNMVAKATGEAPAEAVAAEVVESEPSETLKLLQDTWDKVENKYAVTSLGVGGVLAIWVSTGVISAIEKLPFIPGVLELVGIGYTGWFVYQNLIYQPKREELVEKIRDTYNEITGMN